MIRPIVTALLVAATGWASAQDRPAEEELFGTPSTEASPPKEQPGTAKEAPPAKPTPGTAPASGETHGDHPAAEAELFGTQASPASPPPAPGRMVTREQEDPLKLGGFVYLRSAITWYEGDSVGDGGLSLPNLVDLFLDARPNDRVRAFALARTFWDPTGGGRSPARDALVENGLAPAPDTRPQSVLDQLWLNFDLYHQVYVTAGKQHVKWGVGKFWNPTDYLHPVKRDPLAVFDARTGVTMVKAHWPWESKGWNVYGVALLEQAGRRQTVDTIGSVGGGGRAEVVLGPAELGVDALAQQGTKPRFGVDLSAGVWDLDLYTELAIRTEQDSTKYRLVDPGAPIEIRYVPYQPEGWQPQLVVGGGWAWKYNDEDVLNVGVEYFWNEPGYSDPAVYPFLLLQTAADPTTRAFTPFYLGKQYLGVSLNLPAPGRWNDTIFTLSWIGNLSDRSYTVRLDHSTLCLTYLRVETYVSVYGGTKGGEFRLALDYPEPVGYLPPAVLSAGVALRVNL